MKTTKKSLLIPGDFPPEVSGIATYFHEIWKFYNPDDNIILAAKYKNWKAFDNKSILNIKRVGIPTGSSPFHKICKSIIYTIKTIQLHLKHKFELIHCGQVLSSGFTGWIIKKIFRTPYVIYVYGSETYRFGNNKYLMRLIKLFLNEALCIVPNSKFTENEFINIGIKKNKFHIITPGVDIEKFKPTKVNNSLIEKYNLINKKVLITVSRLDERKGHDKVIEALRILKPEFPEIIYLIVGTGREKPRLKKLVSDYKLESNVIFCGYVSDEMLPEYYNLCDIFILLNRQTTSDRSLGGDYEGFGIVFLEASACAKPVIAGNYGGIYDAIEKNKSGFIVDSTDINKVTGSIKILLTNESKSKNIGNYGYNRAVKNFTWENIATNLNQKIKEIQI